MIRILIPVLFAKDNFLEFLIVYLVHSIVNQPQQQQFSQLQSAGKWWNSLRWEFSNRPDTPSAILQCYPQTGSCKRIITVKLWNPSVSEILVKIGLRQAAHNRLGNNLHWTGLKDYPGLFCHKHLLLSVWNECCTVSESRFIKKKAKCFHQMSCCISKKLPYFKSHYTKCSPLSAR